MSPLRDPARTRAAILAAAERLFAAQGYEHTSMQQIGEAAGYARATPAYFFASKEELYRRVVDGVLARAAAATAPAVEVAARGRSTAEVLSPLVDAFLGFAAADPGYVPLLQRASLRAEPSVESFVAPEQLAALLAALERVAPGVDARLLVADCFALCWFPYAHARTVLRSLELDPYAPEFVAAHRRRVVAILAAGAQMPRPGDSNGGPGS